MSPNKLFDYLDGKLPEHERTELEDRIAHEPTLQRELAIARKLHNGMRGSAEIVGALGEDPGVTQRGALVGRRVAAAFAVLVFVNVAIGLWFISRSTRTAADRREQAAIRRQVEQAVEKSATTELPPPKIEPDEIKIETAAPNADSILASVITAARGAGGSAAKALSDASGTIVLVDLPKNREGEFRELLAPLHAQLPPMEKTVSLGAPNDRKFLQIRIVQVPPASQP